MSAAAIATQFVVTPAKVRRRVRAAGVREQRGPVARQPRIAMPAGRPVQPNGPEVAGGPVRLRLVGGQERRAGVASAARRTALAGSVQLTDRGLAVVISLIAVIAVATVGVGLVKFFGVSNAPLDAHEQAPAHQAMVVDAGSR